MALPRIEFFTFWTKPDKNFEKAKKKLLKSSKKMTLESLVKGRVGIKQYLSVVKKIKYKK